MPPVTHPTSSRSHSSSYSHPSPTTLRNDLRTHGFTVLPTFLPRSLIDRLLITSRILTIAARAGDWPHIRTCPKQFPPWPNKPGDDGIWGVQHLLHPELWRDDEGRSAVMTREQAAVFAELYFGEGILAVVKEILEVSEGSETQSDENVVNDDGDASAAPAAGREIYSDGRLPQQKEPLTMELLNLLVSPPHDFKLRWHRDTVSFSQSIEEEAAALGLIQQSYAEDSHGGYAGQGESSHGSHSHESNGHGGGFARTEHSFYTLHPALRQKGYTQYNIPLTSDNSLHLIPGSHLRPRTPAEESLLANDPCTDELQGWIEVRLQPGDVVFYDNNLIHRGIYRGVEGMKRAGDAMGNGLGDGARDSKTPEEERYTLHGSIARLDSSTDRAKNVLQHGVDSWIARCDFAELLADVSGREGEVLRSRAEGMKRNLLELGRSSGGEEAVGYAHGD